MLGGILFPIAAIIHPNGEDLTSVRMPNWIPAHLLGWVSAAKAGWLGFTGFVLAFLGSGFASTVQYVTSALIPLIAAQAPALFDQAMTPPSYAALLFVFGFVLGHILFGLATFRANVLPHWSGILVTVGMLIFFVGELTFLGQRIPSPGVQAAFDLIRRLHVIILLGDAAFGFGFAWMGYALWSEKQRVA
jgi:hypothetical protein